MGKAKVAVKYFRPESRSVMLVEMSTLLNVSKGDNQSLLAPC